MKQRWSPGEAYEAMPLAEFVGSEKFGIVKAYGLVHQHSINPVVGSGVGIGWLMRVIDRAS